MREHLVNLVNQLGLGSKVYFTGRVSDDELYSVIYHSNLVILPSRYEPFGISSLEAMALGKPLIATNRGGPTDFVKHMDNGILANPDNPDEIAYYAEMVLKDEGLAKRLGERARETVTKGYTWDIIARKTYEVYKATLEERVRVNW